MRLPRPCLRLRLRTLLIAVAVAGLALGGWTMWKRREYCLERAAYCAAQEQLRRDDAARSERQVQGMRSDPRYRVHPRDGPFFRTLDARTASNRQMEAQYGELRRRYERTAWRPWLPIPTDPP